MTCPNCESLQSRLAACEKALLEIANHPHNTELTASDNSVERSYKIGIQDGHRCAAQIARDALANRGGAAARGQWQHKRDKDETRALGGGGWDDCDTNCPCGREHRVIATPAARGEGE